MSQYLPYNRFERLKKRDWLVWCKFSWWKQYLLEVDFEYPDKLHRWDNNLSLVTKKLEISCDMLSKHCSDVADQHGIKVEGV